MNKIPQAANPNDPLSQMQAFIEIVKYLRKDCPWDRKQTHQSIAHLLIEEAYETVDAINKSDFDEFKKELGDLLLHVVMHSVMAEEENHFALKDVIEAINSKMVSRHPHVFADVKAESSEQVLDNWEKIKMTEGRKSALEGVPQSLPALLRAERMQEKASRVGFDWDDKRDVWNKVYEELGELQEELEAGNKARIAEEFGDLFFALVNAARFEGVVPEQALQFTNEKFIRRFQYIEAQAAKMKINLSNMSLEDMDKLWEEAKRLE